MKKIYATIFAALIGSTALMAQEEEHTLSFVQNGQVLANGATITVSEVEYQDLTAYGMGYAVEMAPKLSVRNNDEVKVKATMDCEGSGANFERIEFCFGNCYSWAGRTKLTSTVEIPASSDYTAQIHVGGTFVDEKNYSISDATVKLTLYPEMDPDDAVTLTVNFDTTGAGIKAAREQKPVEVYNLCGKKVATSTLGLSKGIYIIKEGGVSRKVTVK